MFSLSRTSPQQITRPVFRTWAAGIRTKAKFLPNDPAGPSKAIQKEDQEHYAKLSNKRVPVNPHHGLYGFFRKVPGEKQFGDRYEVVETPEQKQLLTGRAWEAAELRNKSFKDLHTLWYITLREQNLLATQKEEARRMGVANVDLQVSMDKVRACRKTMARIKYVLNERRLAYEGAMQLAQEDIFKRVAKTVKSRPINNADYKVLSFQRGEASSVQSFHNAQARKAREAEARKAEEASEANASEGNTEAMVTPETTSSASTGSPSTTA